MDYASRQQRLRPQIAQHSLDALLVTHLPNIRYLCGFTGSNAALLVSARSSVLVTDGRYTTQARDEVEAARVVIAKGGLLADTVKHVRSRTALGFEADHMTVATQSTFKKLLPQVVRLKPANGLVERLRCIKDAEEIAHLRRAVALGSSLFDHALKAIAPGVSEAEVAGAIEYAARRAGADGMSFETIVAAGKRSALPHGRATAARLPRRGFVVLDFGVILGGYCSDMTRTVHLGKPGARARALYGAVREAQQAASQAVRPGVTTGEVDAAARRVLQRAGLGRWFTHSTGHGVGLEIHEAPRVARSQAEELRPGMVITIEPGVYLPGEGGVRIEDMVLVTERGVEVLTPTTKELISL